MNYFTGKTQNENVTTDENGVTGIIFPLEELEHRSHYSVCCNNKLTLFSKFKCGKKLKECTKLELEVKSGIVLLIGVQVMSTCCSVTFNKTNCFFFVIHYLISAVSIDQRCFRNEATFQLSQV